MRRAPALAAIVGLWSGGGLAGCTGHEVPVEGSVGPGAAGGHDRVALVRPDTPGGGLQFAFDDGDVVESIASPGGRFRVHFAREGANAVPAADDDGSGVPDFVEEVAVTYDEVLAAYEDLGFRAPLDDGDLADDGGDDRFDVYLVDFAGIGDGVYRDDGCMSESPQRCAGFMTQENDFAGYGYPSTAVATRILASHELFHAIQSAYDNGQGSVLGEGSAVWATERFDPSLPDFEWFLDGYLDNPDRPLDEPLPGPVDPFSYGAALFFQFLDERFGLDVVVGLLEATEDGAGGVADPYWLERLDPLLAGEGSSFAEAFTDFARWNLFTDDLADPDVSYAAGDGYPRVRIETATLPHEDDRLRLYRASAQYVGLPPGGRAAVTAAVVPTALAPDGADGVRLLLATETDDAITVLDLEDVTAGAQAIDTSGADRVVVVVVNTAIDGDSRKPGLCVGTVDEVAACKETLGAIDPGGEGGGGGTTTSGAGGAPDGSDGPGDGGGGGSDPAASDGSATDDGGCACAVPGAIPTGEIVRGAPRDDGGPGPVGRRGGWLAAVTAAAVYARLRRGTLGTA